MKTIESKVSEIAQLKIQIQNLQNEITNLQKRGVAQIPQPVSIVP